MVIVTVMLGSDKRILVAGTMREEGVSLKHMRKAATYVLVFFVVIMLGTVMLTISQIEQTKSQLTDNLQYRSSLLSDGLREAVEPNFVNLSKDYLQSLVEKYANRKRVAGLAVVDSSGAILAESSSLPKGLPESEKVAVQAMDGDKEGGDFTHQGQYYAFATPLHGDRGVVGALLVVQNADYINSQLSDIWKRNFTYLLLQILLGLIIAVLVLRWFIYLPVRKLAAKLRVARWANDESEHGKMDRHILLGPIMKEMSQLQDELAEARRVISEQIANDREHKGRGF